MAHIDLRRATPADAQAIRSLTRSAYARWVPVIGREPAPMTVDYDIAVVRHRFDLLEIGGALAGLIETVDEGTQLLVENVAVAPAFQRRGLGRRLLTHAEGLARGLGRPRVRLYANRLFTENIRLYQSLGYVVDSEEDVGFAVRTHMSKAVDDRDR